MIFRRSVLRELANNALAVFVALFAIMVTTSLVRLLGQAAGGKIASEAVLALLGFGALQYLAMLLTLTLFLSVLITISRSYRDSEMVVWFSAGLPLSAWVRPVLTFGVPLVLAVAALSFFLTPWAKSSSTEYRRQLDSRDDMSQVAPGTFRESANADRVFFVESGSGEAGEVKNVFISTYQHGRLGVMMAGDGYLQTVPNGDRFVVLLEGHRYEGTPGTSEYRVMEFERYGVRMETKEAMELVIKPQMLSTLTLLRKPNLPNLGELSFRIGLPVAALALALLAIPLGFADPRAGRTSNLLLATLVFLTYTNLLGVTEAWVSQGRLSFAAGLVLVHLTMFVAMMAIFSRRLWPWLRAFRGA